MEFDYRQVDFLSAVCKPVCQAMFTVLGRDSLMGALTLTIYMDNP